jgi:hypothetical protein
MIGYVGAEVDSDEVEGELVMGDSSVDVSAAEIINPAAVSEAAGVVIITGAVDVDTIGWEDLKSTYTT